MSSTAFVMFRANMTAGSSAGIWQQLLSSPIAGVFASIISAIIVYGVRQRFERRKLKAALVTEVKQMEGIQDCADQMERVSRPPGRQLKPKDVPTPGSVPTTVYESSTARIGLLNGFLLSNELKEAVSFYSKVLRYKSIISSISSGEEVSDTDQEDLYDNISEIADERDEIVNNSQFI